MVSPLRIPISRLELSNGEMKTIDEIRRENLAILKDEARGVGKLAEQLERSSAQVSQWLNGSANSGTGKARGMSDDTCRYIEEKCGKPKGWMDRAHEQTSANDAGDLVELVELITLYGRADQRGKLAIINMARATVDSGLAADDELKER